jgi:LysM repeat protein
VQSGDSLYLIAKAFDTTVPKIRAKNPSIKGDQLKVGQKLKIPKE